jgi:hypothetical protein
VVTESRSLSVAEKKSCPPAALLTEVAHQTSRPVPGSLTDLSDALQERFGTSLDAVLLYGSRLHADTGSRGMIDLFVVVNNYKEAYPGPMLRTFNVLLPPNVFYLEVGPAEERLHAKYSVLSRAHLDKGTSRWFHSYVWARLAQPCRIVWARDDVARQRVHMALGQAVLRFHAEVAPTLVGREVTSGAIWNEGLVRTYASELRPEGTERAEWLVEQNGEDYERLTTAVEPAVAHRLEPIGQGRFRPLGRVADARRARLRWFLRRAQGKVLSVLRLGKSALIFEGAAEYVAMKVERHTGSPIAVPPFVRRHPFIGAPYALVVLLVRRVIR